MACINVHPDGAEAREGVGSPYEPTAPDKPQDGEIAW
jgi:hypothetical protein